MDRSLVPGRGHRSFYLPADRVNDLIDERQRTFRSRLMEIIVLQIGLLRDQYSSGRCLQNRACLSAKLTVIDRRQLIVGGSRTTCRSNFGAIEADQSVD
jgi:hypothetical protein